MLAILALHHPLTQAEYFPIDAFGNDAFIVPVFLCVLETGPGAAA
ncbi:hypothetical protein SDC9_90839 [bioreactor metagenome]|uniref:Uncharacterized protein n=1 Tax=bioreactor metagenome TaxID=1076179 RepID=A0A644ZW68_9ZZZZ|nr:hypothetical protein [Candidatus Pelethousia sp.]